MTGVMLQMQNTYLSFSYQHSDGYGVMTMVLRNLQSKRQSSAMLRLMILYMAFALLALGFKSALFSNQVRGARTQQTKTCAWTAI